MRSRIRFRFPHRSRRFSSTQIFTGINMPLAMDRATITPAGIFRLNLNQARGGASGLAAITFGAAPPAGAVPEPATWAMMIGGFGLAGGALRARRRKGKLAYSL